MFSLRLLANVSTIQLQIYITIGFCAFDFFKILQFFKMLLIFWIFWNFQIVTILKILIIFQNTFWTSFRSLFLLYNTMIKWKICQHKFRHVWTSLRPLFTLYDMIWYNWYDKIAKILKIWVNCWRLLPDEKQLLGLPCWARSQKLMN